MRSRDPVQHGAHTKVVVLPAQTTNRPHTHTVARGRDRITVHLADKPARKQANTAIRTAEDDLVQAQRALGSREPRC